MSNSVVWANLSALQIKDALYRIWCGVNRLGDSGVNRLGDTSAFVNPAGQLLLKESSNLRHIYRNKYRVHTTYNDTAKKIIRYTGRKLSHFEVEVL